VEIINSIVADTNGGLYLNSSSQAQIKDSIFWGIDNGNVLQMGSSTVDLADGPVKITSLGLGSGNSFVDPQLDGSYHLMATSPAIDKGTALQAAYPQTDGAGKPRITGNAPDPGPFEDF
jgi:hypothetical protein